MWNNIPPANTKMNKFECLMVHKGHLERLAQARKVINTKKGTPMAFVKIFDDTGELEVTIFSDLFSKNMKYLEVNKLILIKGSNRTSRGETSFIASEIISLEE